METIRCIETRRSIRNFKDKLIDRDVVKELVELATWAPTWKNCQASRFTAIDNRNVITEISSAGMPAFNKKIADGAPLLIAVSAIRGRSGYEKDGTPTTQLGEAYTHFDCGGVCQTLCLAANDMGIGTVEMGIFDELKVKKILNIPENEDLLIIIACGYPADVEVAAPKRKAVDDVLRFI